MTQNYRIPSLPLSIDLETKAVLRQLSRSHRMLAELKGVSRTIPNEAILLNTLVLQEAKDSLAVENIVTTHDELFKADMGDAGTRISSIAAKEVLSYRQAVQLGFERIRNQKLLTINVIKEIQATLERNKAGFRKLPGTKLKTGTGETVYEPPQNPDEIERYMADLERFVNDPLLQDIDPLVKLSIIHHQFESIHPFYDGNGRTGRIISILYLVINDLLDLPVLYLSRYINKNKMEYYRLLQNIRDFQENNSASWEEWILFTLKGIEDTARETIHLVNSIVTLMAEYKQKLRPRFGRKYKHELLNNLFKYPYTKIGFLEEDMGVGRATAVSYLDAIVQTGLLVKVKWGRSNYYLNTRLVDLLLNHSTQPLESFDSVESVHSHAKE